MRTDALGGQCIPSVCFGNQTFRVGFFCHFQKQNIGQFRDILMVCDTSLDWFSAREEGLGNLYEGLLEKNASEKKCVGFFCHFQKQNIGQFRDILMVCDTVIAKDVAEVPELGYDFLCGPALGVCAKSIKAPPPISMNRRTSKKSSRRLTVWTGFLPAKRDLGTYMKVC